MRVVRTAANLCELLHNRAILRSPSRYLVNESLLLFAFRPRFGKRLQRPGVQNNDGAVF
jgi:hypothetical protein